MHEHRYDGTIARLRSPERLAWLEVNRVVELCLQDEQFNSVLDIGTGSGIFAEAFSIAGLTAEGVDANSEMLEAARKLVPGLFFQQGTAEALPCPNAAFDLVFMGMLLHETDDRHKAMQEAARVTCRRVAILEWPYIVSDKGPGLDERLSEKDIRTLADQVGLIKMQVFPLESLVLYLLDK